MLKKRKEFKILMALVCIIACVGFLTSCGNEKQGKVKPEKKVVEDEKNPIFDVLPLEFVFSSGAGAWQSIITLNSDGSFKGTYSDAEMGSNGEDYPNGTVYTCEFSGKFEEIKQVNDYTYTMTLTEVTTEKKEGEEWIEDQIRYVAAGPYGLENGKEFLLYTPETPIKELSEEFLNWWPKRYLQEEQALEKLSCYGIYNKETESGFFTYE